MIDINALFSQALTAAVAEAIKPLEARVTDVTAQLARALLADLAGRVNALEAAPAGLQRFADGRPITAESIREIANAAAEAALDEHCSSYDHDDYDSHVNDDDKHFDGDVGEAVREALDGQSFTISL